MKRFMRPWYVTPRQATAMSAPSSWTTSGPLRLCRRSNPDQLRQFLQQLHVLDQEIAHDFADIPALLQRDALQTLLQLAVKVDRQTYARFLPAKLASLRLGKVVMWLHCQAERKSPYTTAVRSWHFRPWDSATPACVT